MESTATTARLSVSGARAHGAGAEQNCTTGAPAMAPLAARRCRLDYRNLEIDQLSLKPPT